MVRPGIAKWRDLIGCTVGIVLTRPRAIAISAMFERNNGYEKIGAQRRGYEKKIDLRAPKCEK